MTTPASPPQIDYTSRDYLSLRQDMIDLIRTRIPEWTSRSPNDFGIALIELFAYMGDILSYYGDRIANESYLATATQYDSILNIARMLDYYPSGPVAASVVLQFSNTTNAYQWVLSGTQVATKAATTTKPPSPSDPYANYTVADPQSVYFETVQDVLVPPNGSATVTARQGVTYNELVGYSSNAVHQDFPLFRTPVIEDSIAVYVGNTQWAYYERLIDAYANTRAYTLERDTDNVVHVVFGDGANGALPGNGSAINVAYRVGGGTVGNVAKGFLTRIVSTVPAGIKVTNLAPAVGGGNAETPAQIRVNAAQSLFTLQRAVSLADYTSLALRVGGVAKASVPTPAVYSSVTLFLAPAGGQTAAVDASGNAIPGFIALQNRVTNYLADKIPLGTTVTMGTPVFVPLSLQIAVTVRPKYKRETVRQAAIKAVYQLFAFDNVTFGDSISLKDVHTALSTIAGVQAATVSSMTRDTAPAITVDSFDTALTGPGWAVDAAVKVEGTASNRNNGTSSGSRTFAPLDLSGMTELQIRGSYTASAAAQAYLVTTITLTDINGAQWPLGSRTHGTNPGQGLNAGAFNAARWPLTWPGDLDVFDATRITGYTVSVVPKNIPGNTFYLDMLTAYTAVTNDLNFAAWELPAPFGTGQSALILTAAGGIA